MFTGIITAIGTLQKPTPLGDSSHYGKRLCIHCPPDDLDDVGLGDSIALNGACMTVTTLDKENGAFTVDISAESLQKTTGLDGRGRVNLEKALRAGDRLGGHWVSGHVDGIGTVKYFESIGESWELRILAPLALAKYFVYKGSIAINGVSLTINSVNDLPTGCMISINLIPHTVENTMLCDLAAGSWVNLEVDTVARYVERMLGAVKVG